MDVGHIQRFMRGLGCTKISIGSRWVRSTCPMGHLHSGGKDRQPSFAISIDPGGASNCRCQACGIYGDLLALVWRAARAGRARSDLFYFLVEHNQLDVEKLGGEKEPAPDDLAGQLRAYRKYDPSRRTKRKSNFVHPDDEPQAEVPEDVLRKMIADMPDYVREYLTRTSNPIMGVKGRGLTDLTVEEWELGWHLTQRRIAIPIRDETGKLVAISGRAFEDQKPKYLHSRFKRDRVLFGEHRHDDSIRSGYLFEGFFQTIFTWQCGYANVLAPMGTHLSQQQARKLVRWFDHLTIVPDGDKAGQDAAERHLRTLSDLELPREGGGTDKIEKIDIAAMPKGKDADTLKPNVLVDILGPRNTA